MAARKKATAKSTGKAVKRKQPVQKVAAKKLSTVTVKDPLSKGALMNAIVEMTGLIKKDVVTTIDALSKIIELHVKSRGPGKFVMPGLLKITVVKKPAKPARKGINPFTGEEVMFKAKPAHKVVKIKALKKLKEMTE
jgi:nucleoid DNA-binding protein